MAVNVADKHPMAQVKLTALMPAVLFVSIPHIHLDFQ